MPIKVVCVAGARPNFMKIAPILRSLRARPAFDARLVHTGQHYDDKLSKIFFDDLKIPRPDVELSVGSASHAVQARNLSQQTFDADKKKYELGAGTPYQVVQDQRDLASAQSSEAQAMANYSHARIALDQALGRTLDVNHVSMEEALSGRSSAVPSVPPQGVK